MLSRVYTASLTGIDAELISVETNILPGLPALNLVGLPGTEIKEARERMRSAVLNMGISFPTKRITINLSPADTKKEGSHFDLPMAMGIIGAMGVVPPERLRAFAFIGELSLDGRINGVHGVLPLVEGLYRSGIKNIILPIQNVREAALVRDVRLYPVESLHEAIAISSGEYERACYERPEHEVGAEDESIEDFADVAGQEAVKRAITIAVAGMHNLAMVGFPGSGKSMLAKRIPSIMPEMSYEEKLEVTKIFSVAGMLSENQPLVSKRPFRSPHHTISSAGLIGGGSKPKPGELSLAHCGVMFLDEFPEFAAKNLEMLRQPMEDGAVTISRASGSCTFPSRIMLVVAGNPCKCGYYGDQLHQCTCTPAQLSTYQSKFSGPILDRIDLQVEVLPVAYSQLTDAETMHISSACMRHQVETAHEVQKARYAGSSISYNSQLMPGQMRHYCRLDGQCAELMHRAFETLALSARSYNRILKVSRTIADIELSEKIKAEHIAEALSYRGLDKLYRR